MKRPTDHTGKRFGALTALRLEGRRGREVTWRCMCACGAETVVRAVDLVSENTKSCGCRATAVKHGAARKAVRGRTTRSTVEYRTWERMKQRCHNPKHPRYPDWGGRGISVCERWRLGFEAFLADMGPRPPSCTSIDRIDNDGDYEPGNCRWATASEQQQNTRKTKR